MKNIMANLLQTYNNELREEYETILNVLNNISFDTIDKTLFFLQKYDKINDIVFNTNETSIVSIEDVINNKYYNFLSIIVSTIIGKQFKHIKPLLIKDNNNIKIPANSFIPVLINESIYYMFTSKDIFINISNDSNVYITIKVFNDGGNINLEIDTINVNTTANITDLIIGYVNKDNNITLLWEINNSFTDNIIKYDNDSIISYFTDINIQNWIQYNNILINTNKNNQPVITNTDLVLNEQEMILILQDKNTDNYIDKTIDYKIYNEIYYNNKIVYTGLFYYDSTYGSIIIKDFNIDNYKLIYNNYEKNTFNYKIDNIYQANKSIYQYITYNIGTLHLNDSIKVSKLILQSKIYMIRNKQETFTNQSIYIADTAGDTTDITDITDLALCIDNASSYVTSDILDNKNIKYVDDIMFVNENKLQIVLDTYNGSAILYFCDLDYLGNFSDFSDNKIDYVVNNSTNELYKVININNKYKLIKINEFDPNLLSIKINFDTFTEQYNCIKFEADKLYINKPLQQYTIQVLSLSNNTLYIKPNVDNINVTDYLYLLTPKLDDADDIDAIKQGKPNFNITKVQVDSINDETDYKIDNANKNNKYSIGQIYKLLPIGIKNNIIDDTNIIDDNNNIQITDYYLFDEANKEHFKPKYYPIFKQYDNTLTTITDNKINIQTITDVQAGDIIKFTGTILPTEITSDILYNIKTVDKTDASNILITLTDSNNDDVTITDGVNYNFNIYKQVIEYNNLFDNNTYNRLDTFIVSIDLSNASYIANDVEKAHTYANGNLQQFKQNIEDNYYALDHNNYYAFNQLVLEPIETNYISSLYLNNNFYYKWEGNYYLIKQINQIVITNDNEFLLVNSLFEKNKHYIFNDNFYVYKNGYLLSIDKQITFKIPKKNITYIHTDYNEAVCTNNKKSTDTFNLIKYKGKLFDINDIDININNTINIDSNSVDADDLIITYNKNNNKNSYVVNTDIEFYKTLANSFTIDNTNYTSIKLTKSDDIQDVQPNDLLINVDESITVDNDNDDNNYNVNVNNYGIITENTKFGFNDNIIDIDNVEGTIFIEDEIYRYKYFTFNTYTKQYEIKNDITNINNDNKIKKINFKRK